VASKEVFPAIRRGSRLPLAALLRAGRKRPPIGPNHGVTSTAELIQVVPAVSLNKLDGGGHGSGVARNDGTALVVELNLAVDVFPGGG
jgi:hypothetical protein